MPRQRAVQEIAEAFAPVNAWQYATPIERTTDLNLAMLDTLTTLAFWGWAVNVTRARGRWTVQVAKTVKGKTLKAKVEGVSYPDALWRLRDRLEHELASVNLQDEETEAAA